MLLTYSDLLGETLSATYDVERELTGGGMIAGIGYVATTVLYGGLGLAATVAIGYGWRRALWRPSVWGEVRSFRRAVADLTAAARTWRESRSTGARPRRATTGSRGRTRPGSNPARPASA